MQWCNLVDWEEERLWRGTIFRLCVTEWPHEAQVDLMLIEAASSPSGFSLMVSTGYKAGLVLAELPKSANARGKVRAISRKWLMKNWSKKIYSVCPVEKVLLISNDPPGL
jgi:hypothetical protein